MPIKELDKKRKYQREWIKNRRFEWLAENGPCKQCGSSFELEVDHIDPKDKVTHRIWSWSKERRLEELKKCQVLCQKCHAQKSLKDFGKIPAKGRHGVYGMYSWYGCRCKLCKGAAREKRLVRYQKEKDKKKKGGY